ncbi:hypothetical protein CCB80_10260 [Armatimonadetes bacterium Uphvl-Ar1]|nr:hypothetical protein CCB80_10260 [Armatimonadetes bacterium Uphvl-Ar1]
MSASVLYTNFGGMLVHEDRGGVERTYVHDEMGNTRYLLDSSNVTDTYSYTPYGQVTHVGTSVTPFTFIGALGYFATGWSHLTSYVRARWYSSVSGSWGSVDPIWPWQKAYQYVDGNPTMWTDKFGLHPAIAACIGAGVISAGTLLLSNVFGGNATPADIACSSLGSCIKAFVLTLIAPVGALLGCVVGALVGALTNVLSDICKCYLNAGRSKCEKCGISPCDLLSSAVFGAFGCALGKVRTGNDGLDLGNSLVTFFLGLLFGLVDSIWGISCSTMDPSGGIVWSMPK